MIRFIFFFVLFNIIISGFTQMPDATKRTEGEGPFDRLIIRGVILVDGTGSPPVGPVDIVVEKNKITQISIVGFPGVPVIENRRPTATEKDRVLDATGMYLLPGFVDMHGHIGGRSQGTTPDYVFKLWLAHGITTVREPGSGNGLEWTIRHKNLSNRNEITAPRIKSYINFGSGYGHPISTPEMARDWVRSIAKQGADGIKFFGARPEIMLAALDEAKKLNLKSAAHHAQMNVARQNVLHSARMGLTTMEHWYGLPESMMDGRTIQDYRLDYNYQNEQHRFSEAGKLWEQAAKPYSDKWNTLMDELISLNFTINPTFNIYEANRDLMRAYRAEWHEHYTLPSLWEFYQPSLVAHGSYWFHWGTEEEVQWRNNYRLWMTFINEYKNRGGRVTLGSDSGFIFQLYGFGYIREMELFREAGFHPIEIIRSATLYGAEALGMAHEIGSVEVGKLADFVILDENPLENLKVLYGTGTVKLNENNEAVRVGSVRYTIKDGIIFDSRQLLQDVKNMVDQKKDELQYQIYNPGKK